MEDVKQGGILCFIMLITEVFVLEILKWITFLLVMEIKILLCCPD